MVHLRTDLSLQWKEMLFEVILPLLGVYCLTNTGVDFQLVCVCESTLSDLVDCWCNYEQ